MQEIQDYFDILTAEGREIRPNVFIATDEPKIIDEIQTKVISYRGGPPWSLDSFIHFPLLPGLTLCHVSFC